MGVWPPLTAGLLAHRARKYVGFHVPGHKQGRGAWPAWHALLGEAVFALDLTELPDLDNLQDPSGIIKEAADAAAAYFGAEETFFLVNGTTAGVLAMFLAVCRPGDYVLVPRACHQSVVHGMILSGANPVYLPVRFHREWGLPGALQTRDLDTALNSFASPPRALLLFHPNYYGLAGELKAQVQLAHARQVVVLVDEAHGAHFCTSSRFPVPSLRVGTDLVAQGVHKVLGAFTQAALLHCRGDLVDREMLRQALRIIQTSSPSYLLLASLDVARYQCSQEEKKWEEAALLGMDLRRKVSQIPGLFAPGEELKEVPGVVSFDPTRLLVNVKGLGISGFTAAAWLRRERRILVEMADFYHILFILGPGDLDFAASLRDALAALAEAFGPSCGTPKVHFPKIRDLPLPRQVITPRDAFSAPRREIPLTSAEGKIAAEVVAPYPPGIPVICPGEEISAEALAYLVAWERAGGAWPGQKKGKIQVVAES